MKKDNFKARLLTALIVCLLLGSCQKEVVIGQKVQSYDSSTKFLASMLRVDVESISVDKASNEYYVLGTNFRIDKVRLDSIAVSINAKKERISQMSAK